MDFRRAIEVFVEQNPTQLSIEEFVGDNGLPQWALLLNGKVVGTWEISNFGVVAEKSGENEVLDAIDAIYEGRNA